MKKLLIILLAILTALFFVACPDNPDSGDSGDAGDAGDGGTVEVIPEIITLDTWTQSIIITGADSDWFELTATPGSKYRITTSDSFWQHSDLPASTSPESDFDNEIGAYTDYTDTTSNYDYNNLIQTPNNGQADISDVASHYIEITATSSPVYIRVTKWVSTDEPIPTVTQDLTSWVYVEEAVYHNVTAGTITGEDDGSFDEGIDAYAEGDTVTILATAGTSGQSPNFTTDVAVNNEVVTSLNSDQWQYQFTMPTSDVEVSVEFDVPTYSDIGITYIPPVVVNNNTFTIEVSALDQFGNKMIAPSANTVEITDNATATLSGTTSKTLSTTSESILFDDLVFSATNEETGITITATETTNNHTSTATIDIAVPLFYEDFNDGTFGNTTGGYYTDYTGGNEEGIIITLGEVKMLVDQLGADGDWGNGYTGYTYVYFDITPSGTTATMSFFRKQSIFDTPEDVEIFVNPDETNIDTANWNPGTPVASFNTDEDKIETVSLNGLTASASNRIFIRANKTVGSNNEEDGVKIDNIVVINQ